MRRYAMRLWARAQRGKADPFTSAVLTVPVFLLYHLGILVIDQRNGVDWISELMLGLLEHSVAAYVGVTLGLSLALGVGLWLLRRRGALKPVALAGVVVESALLALVMLVSVGYATAQVTRLTQLSWALRAPELQAGGALARLGPVDKLVLAAGAGFHEELVFRVALFSGGALALSRLFGMQRAAALLGAALGSALVFALVHHLGPYGDPLALAPLLFRTLAALYLTLVYAARGFAVAVYTHTLYDVLVFFG